MPPEDDRHRPDRRHPQGRLRRGPRRRALRRPGIQRYGNEVAQMNFTGFYFGCKYFCVVKSILNPTHILPSKK